MPLVGPSDWHGNPLQVPRRARSAQVATTALLGPRRTILALQQESTLQPDLQDARLAPWGNTTRFLPKRGVWGVPW